jgi:hypothetical protein
MLDVICFEARQRHQFEKWIDTPHAEPPPLTARKGKIIEITWTDVADRLDNEPYSNRNKKQIAEVTCERDQLQVLIPVRDRAQKALSK